MPRLSLPLPPPSNQAQSNITLPRCTSLPLLKSILILPVLSTAPILPSPTCNQYPGLLLLIPVKLSNLISPPLAGSSVIPKFPPASFAVEIVYPLKLILPVPSVSA